MRRTLARGPLRRLSRVTRRHRDLDEDDVRVRPGKGKSRARSKVRPEHGQSRTAMVTAVDRGRFTTVLLDEPARQVYAVKAREIGRKGLVVGDQVDLVGDVSGGDDALARIVRRQGRRPMMVGVTKCPSRKVMPPKASAAISPPPMVGKVRALFSGSL